MSANPETAIISDIAALRASIEDGADVTELVLKLEAEEVGRARLELPGQEELCRQLAALRERVASAASNAGAPGELRSELATLLFFAKTLRSDAEAWRAGIRQAVHELERKRAAAAQERERAAAEQAQLRRERDALQLQIDLQAGRMARQKGGECRRTVPVVTLRPGVTVSSMTVSSPRKRLRSLRLWLVTLDAAREDVLVLRD